jgi:integrase
MDVREVLTQYRANGGSYGYQKKMKHIINQCFVFGMESGLIRGVDRSPSFGVQIERREERKPEILTIGEIRKLLIEAKNLRHPWYPIWAMALLTGMRSGELYALLWSDVDWENKAITVSKSYNCRLKQVKTTKAGYWRTVPISSELIALLRELKATAGGRPSVLPRFRDWTLGYQATELRKFCLGIGIPSVKFHALRACFATQLVRNGVPPIQVQKICGWKDLGTMQCYVRLAGIEIEGATEGLKVLPEPDVAAQVVSLFTRESV